MIWNKEKFNKEIKALPLLVGKEDVLTATELQNIRRKVLISLRSETNPDLVRYSWVERKDKIMRYVISVLVGLSLFGGTAFASTSAKPGDLLYPVKRVTEKVQLTVAVNQQSKAQLQAKFAQERLQELDELKVENEASVSTTATSSPERKRNQDHDRVEEEARINTQADVSSAVEALKQAQAKLEARGNAQAAAIINQNILKLQSGALSRNIKLEFELEGDSRENRNSDGQTSTTTGNIKIKIEDNGKVEVKVRVQAENENKVELGKNRSNEEKDSQDVEEVDGNQKNR